MGVHVSFELGGSLGEHVAAVTGEGGEYVDPADYLRDLIRRDMAAVDAHRFRTVQEHLKDAMAAPDSAYTAFDPDEFLQRMRSEGA